MSKKRKKKCGWCEVGPSDAFVRLLRGEINSREYVKDLERRVRQNRLDSKESR